MTATTLWNSCLAVGMWCQPGDHKAGTPVTGRWPSWSTTTATTKFAPRGLWRVVVSIWGWVFDYENRSLRQDAIANKSHDDHFKHAKLLQERTGQRLKVLAVLIGLALIGLLLLKWLAPVWVLWALLAVVVAALGYVGRPRDGKPLIVPATTPTGDTPLTNSLVLEALCSLGIPKMTRPD